MKTFILATVLWVVSFSAKSQSCEIYPIINNDTINRIDIKGLKQGQWVIFGRNKPKSGYQFLNRIEEGKYIDNMKTGVWVEYYRDGIIKTKINYLNGRPDGYAAIYNENEKMQEDGFWKNYKWAQNNNSCVNK